MSISGIVAHLTGSELLGEGGPRSAIKELVPSIMITEMVMKIVITIIIIITILTTMIIMMKCSQGEGGPWLAIGELVALYTRPTCDPGP